MDFSFFNQAALSSCGLLLDWGISSMKWTLMVASLARIIALSVGSLLRVLRTTLLAWLRTRQDEVLIGTIH